ncbi:cupin domain-containing protein [Phenylobacterium sp.]|uniref:cupin domain-containing protein n=1 Tax=Phenylobacterium sp. TaxID=1871053 RepID=UPI002ED7EDD5
MNFSRQATAVAGALALTATSASAAPQGEAPLAIKAADPALKWGPCPAIFPAGCEIAVLHGDPAKPNADVFLRVKGGQRLPAHTHTSAERMVLVTGELRVKYQGAPAATLTPGMYAFGPAGLPHEADCRDGQPCTLFIAFEGPVDAAAFQGKLD